jgi:hypothetical protein
MSHYTPESRAAASLSNNGPSNTNKDSYRIVTLETDRAIMITSVSM